MTSGTHVVGVAPPLHFVQQSLQITHVNVVGQPVTETVWTTVITMRMLEQWLFGQVKRYQGVLADGGELTPAALRKVRTSRLKRLQEMWLELHGAIRNFVEAVAPDAVEETDGSDGEDMVFELDPATPVVVIIELTQPGEVPASPRRAGGPGPPARRGDAARTGQLDEKQVGGLRAQTWARQIDEPWVRQTTGGAAPTRTEAQLAQLPSSSESRGETTITTDEVDDILQHSPRVSFPENRVDEPENEVLSLSFSVLADHATPLNILATPSTVLLGGDSEIHRFQDFLGEELLRIDFPSTFYGVQMRGCELPHLQTWLWDFVGLENMRLGRGRGEGERLPK